jgi:hypothetical protein
MDQHIGERFAQALATKDAPALLALLEPDVDFRALTPNRFWEANSASEVVDEIILGTWFDPNDHIESLEDMQTSSVADRDRVSYQLRVKNGDGMFLVEQQAYFAVEHDRINWLRILCSGYRAVDAAESA